MKLETGDILDYVSDQIFVFDREGHLLSSNPACLRFLESLEPEEKGAMIRRLAKLSLELAGNSSEAESRRDVTLSIEGRARTFDARATRAGLGRSVAEGTVLVLREVTEHRASEAEARLQKIRLRQIVDLIPHPIFARDESGRIHLANKAYADAYGTSVEEMEGQLLGSVHTDEEEAERMLSDDRRVIGSGHPLTVQYVFNDAGVERIHRATKIPFVQGGSGEPLVAGLSIDITEERDRKQRLEYLASTDPLTNLSNRRHFRVSLETALRSARRSGRQVALLFLDLHRFKSINDIHGHSIGDQVLRCVARRLEEAIRADDLITQYAQDLYDQSALTVSRFGGDEFIVLLPKIEGPAEAAKVARRLLERLNLPLRIESHVLNVDASMGIAIFPTDGEDSESLLRHCDQALTKAKQSGRGNIEFFSSSLGVAEERRLSVELALRHSLHNDELSLAYQPIWDTRTGRLAGGEALLRWTSRTLGTISPAEFIPVAEQSGLMAPVGARVLRMLCEQIRQWRQSYSMPRMSTNLSAKQVLDPSSPAMIERTLRSAELTGDCLEFELTESSILSRYDHAEKTLPKLRQLGATLALDDFGTGYSSLSHLRHFRFERIKIDQSFVSGIGHSADDEELTRAVIALAHRLGMEVVAEGVETEAQYEFLKDQDCDFLQGWLLGRPMPASDFEVLLQEEVLTHGGERASA